MGLLRFLGCPLFVLPNVGMLGNKKFLAFPLELSHSNSLLTLVHHHLILRSQGGNILNKRADLQPSSTSPSGLPLPARSGRQPF